jgi:16S rRNA (cytosine1402-N4)-methyltransferase
MQQERRSTYSPSPLLFQYTFGKAEFYYRSCRFIPNPGYIMEKSIHKHVPVLTNHVLLWMITDKKGVYFDGTMGDGGHTRAIAEKLEPPGRVVATDCDINAIRHSDLWLKPGDRIKIFHNNFRNIKDIIQASGEKSLSGILLDLGLSSRQLDDPERGFSYRFESALDMRMDNRIRENALQIINKYSEKELRDIFFNFGEENRSSYLAKIIVRERVKEPILTTEAFVEIMQKFWRPKYFTKSASRIFQALRIAVNKELENLEIFLNDCWNLLVPGGRMVIISYHSLEDRMVKQAFRKHAHPCECPQEIPVCVCGKKPDAKILSRKIVVPSRLEIESNSRARSAKLRAVEKI